MEISREYLDAQKLYYTESLKNKNKDYKYIPKISFGGMYECFTKVDYE
jgi:hypothetical protein